MTELHHRITDPEVRELATASALIAADYVEPGEDPWQLSPFGWIRTTQSRRRGAIGEKLVASWCAAKGFDVIRSPDSNADRIIEGLRVEIKFSTLWDTGVYKFQQIRDQDYEYCFCLGISPFDAHAWFIPKSALNEHVIGHTGQHGGANSLETAWISFPAIAAHAWMAEYGGRLGAVRNLITSAARNRRT